MRIKDICDYVSRGATPDYVDESPYKVMNQATFSKGWLDESNVRYTSKAIQDAQIQKSDLIMASTGGGVLGKVFYYDSDDNHFYADSHVSILRNSRGTNLMKYLYYFFSVRYDEINATLVKGSTNQTELQRNYLLAYELDIPSLQVQQRIVEYLDAKTTEIDKKIELLGKKRDAYKRLKIATINRAVTRGLDEHVSLKDSGMDWIDQIPEHWEAARIKDVVSEIFMGTSPVYEYEEDNNNFVFGQRNNQLDGINFDDIKFAKDSFFNERQEYEFLKYGDVLINTLGGGSVGRTGYYDKNDDVRVITDGHIMVLRSKTYDTKYMYYYLLSRKERLENMAIGSTNQSFFNVSDVRVIPIPKPSSLEQKQIAAYLDDRCAKIDAAVTIIDKQIDALKRLKRSLINEVVTGKRKV